MIEHFINYILDKWGIEYSYKEILTHWNEPHRYYHSQTHLDELLSSITKDMGSYSNRTYEKLIIIALFHDIIYEPGSKDNELKSAEFFMSKCTNKTNNDILLMKQAILDTKTHESKITLSLVFCRYDMSIVTKSFDELLIWENGIRKEYKVCDTLYKIGRLKFLRSLLGKHNNDENINKLIDWVKTNY